jgi:hypothetical protein
LNATEDLLHGAFRRFAAAGESANAIGYTEKSERVITQEPVFVFEAGLANVSKCGGTEFHAE